MDGGLESRCVGRVYGADGAVHGTIFNDIHTCISHVPSLIWVKFDTRTFI